MVRVHIENKGRYKMDAFAGPLANSLAQTHRVASLPWLKEEGLVVAM